MLRPVDGAEIRRRLGDKGLAIIEVAFLGTGTWFLLSPVTRVIATLALAEAGLYLGAAFFSWIQGMRWAPAAHVVCSGIWVAVALVRGVVQT